MTRFYKGKLPNKRGGFYHIHSDSTECGLAFWDKAANHGSGLWFPCSKLVNHTGRCGFEDNSAF